MDPANALEEFNSLGQRRPFAVGGRRYSCCYMGSRKVVPQNLFGSMLIPDRRERTELLEAWKESGGMPKIMKETTGKNL